MATENDYTWEKFIVLHAEYKETVMELFGDEDYIRDYGRTRKEWNSFNLASKMLAFEELHKAIAQVKADFEAEKEEKEYSWENIGEEALVLLKAHCPQAAINLITRINHKLGYAE